MTRTYTTREGDTIQRIALLVYGDPSRWIDIWALNRKRLPPDPLTPIASNVMLFIRI